MKLLRFGDKVINMDQVTDVRLSGNQVYLYFGFTVPHSYSGEPTQVFIELQGIDAQAFLIWLRTNAKYLSVPTPAPAPAPADDIPF